VTSREAITFTVIVLCLLLIGKYLL